MLRRRLLVISLPLATNFATPSDLPEYCWSLRWARRTHVNAQPAKLYLLCDAMSHNRVSANMSTRDRVSRRAPASPPRKMILVATGSDYAVHVHR
ncbi:hypothetical protein F4782DRAFT_253304 [Xylaria castorea]|nr:hypothetical protein F4782DRAFT_253304 [Xylaria castorea]